MEHLIRQFTLVKSEKHNDQRNAQSSNELFKASKQQTYSKTPQPQFESLNHKRSQSQVFSKLKYNTNINLNFRLKEVKSLENSQIQLYSPNSLSKMLFNPSITPLKIQKICTERNSKKDLPQIFTNINYCNNTSRKKDSSQSRNKIIALSEDVQKKQTAIQKEKCKKARLQQFIQKMTEKNQKLKLKMQDQNLNQDNQFDQMQIKAFSLESQVKVLSKQLQELKDQNAKIEQESEK